MVDPNLKYQNKIDDTIQNFYQKHFLEKREKINNYVHKSSNWITSGIIKSIEFRDSLYRKWKMSPCDSPDYSIAGHNLSLYNKYLNQCIYTANKNSFTWANLQNIRTIFKKNQTWDILKHIIDKKKSKLELPPHFIDKDRRVSGSQNIADQFNKCLIQMEPTLAGEIDTANKLAPRNPTLSGMRSPQKNSRPICFGSSMLPK